MRQAMERAVFMAWVVRIEKRVGVVTLQIRRGRRVRLDRRDAGIAHE